MTTNTPRLDPEPLSLPENASLFTRLNPAAGQTFNMSLNANVYASLAEHLRRTKEGRRMLSERPSLQGKRLIRMRDVEPW